MPTNVVKTKHDEKLWKEAKSSAKESSPDDFWALTMHIFQNKKHSKDKKGKKNA